MKSLMRDWSFRSYMKTALSEQTRELAKEMYAKLETDWPETLDNEENSLLAVLKIIAGVADDFPAQLDKELYWSREIWSYYPDMRALYLNVASMKHDKAKTLEYLGLDRKFQEQCAKDCKKLNAGRRELSYDFRDGVLITDPCYLSGGDENWRETFDKGIYADTIYGDWGCTVFSKEGRVPLGLFCADGGLVCAVEPVPEVMEEAVKFGSWCWTLLPDFRGKVTIIHENGECWLEGEDEGNISFITRQTSA